MPWSQTRLVGLFADRAQYGRALGLFWLVHKQLDLVLKENISRGQPGAAGCYRELHTAAQPWGLLTFYGPGRRVHSVLTLLLTKPP